MPPPPGWRPQCPKAPYRASSATLSLHKGNLAWWGWLARGIPHEEDIASPRNVVLGVLAIVGQTPKQVAFVAHKREAVPKPRTRRGPVFGCLCFESLPLPPTCLQNQDSVIELGMSPPSEPKLFVTQEELASPPPPHHSCFTAPIPPPAATTVRSTSGAITWSS